MPFDRSGRPHDPRLEPYLSAADDGTARRRLGELLELEAAPLVQRILRRQLGGRAATLGAVDLEDLQADVLLKLQVQLIVAREGERQPPESFPDYVAVAAFRAAVGFQMARQQVINLRKSARLRLARRLRAVLGPVG